MEEEVKWAKHYSSVQQILLVGEGDFSFSFSLANTFGSASNIVSTSLDSYDTLLGKYSKAKSNLEGLKKLGATVFHGVNVKEMVFHSDLRMRKFDRIVFNFPHAGFNGREDNMMVIKQLVDGFLESAIKMLSSNAEVHITHKIFHPYKKWNLEEVASNNSFNLMECADFRIEDYPGYNKRGEGERSDHPFPLGDCGTFKFKIRYPIKEKKALLEFADPNVFGIEAWLLSL